MNARASWVPAFFEAWGIALLSYLAVVLVTLLAPDRQDYPVIGVVVMLAALFATGFSYFLVLRGARRFLHRLNAHLSYTSVWLSWIITTLLVQQPLWLICRRFHVIKSHDALDNAYFTMVTFLTIGYGDFVPVDAAGRMFAMVVGLLGSAHNVCFVAYLLLLVQPGIRKD
ncbi:potassium channel family protein [Silvimonas amylolytica]|uniref:Potassium channel domain-containing protein n=1 Tax=Silvimonas amylolytica TaxID=449663 RepID=A0ABQ2PMZ8_9NEIS|nr:potassium channel family protein [Silvimonas amylolytica]GGP26997.1 hypothetical protein GCM10010971_28160 [Silvimonas amylolytica]